MGFVQPSRVTANLDSFLESTGPMTTLMNVMLHAIASLDPENAHRRIGEWAPIISGLGLY